MEKKKNHYENLIVSRRATPTEIRMAYRRLASKYHPDRNEGNQVAQDTMVLINEAYSVLKNAEKRAAYDDWLETGSSGSPRDVFGSPVWTTGSDQGAVGISKWYSTRQVLNRAFNVLTAT